MAKYILSCSCGSDEFDYFVDDDVFVCQECDQVMHIEENGAGSYLIEIEE